MRRNGMPFLKAAAGEYVTGAYRQRLTLASGRFAGTRYTAIPIQRSTGIRDEIVANSSANAAIPPKTVRPRATRPPAPIVE